MAVLIQKTINANIPYVPWLTGYIAILVGAGATFVLQSSSVFTSALTPLVGMGVISVNRMYPLCLGSNLGTTTTAIIAALTASPQMLKYTMQISLCHFFFNLTGIALFYPLPFMRWPLPLCKKLGKTTAEYRWFAFVYLILSFILIPAFVLGLSVADDKGYVLLGLGAPILAILFIVVIINVIQNMWPKILPKFIQNWNFLPLWMRSLEPYDSLFGKACKCCIKTQDNDELEEIKEQDDSLSRSGIENKSFDLH
jgi:solute carrier family 34 (sodium-dependent phosphate cotransporter)